MGNRMMDLEVFSEIRSNAINIITLQVSVTPLIISEKEATPMMRTGLVRTTENTCSKRASKETRACLGQIRGVLNRR